MQRKIGTTPDGFWGPKSIAACQKYLRGLMPTPNPWPASDTESLVEFYGMPWNDESLLKGLDVTGMGVKYGGATVNSITCHVKVKDSLGRIVQALSGFEAGRRVLARYDGCYNNRAMRNGTRKSLHAFAAAVDFDCYNNANLAHWPASATMPLEVMEVFAREGWLSAGAFWGRDAMHFQATA